MTEDIKYYERRLKFIKELFKDHRMDLLQGNKNRIINIVRNYNEFKAHPDYDPILAEFPQTFILANQ